MSFLIDNNSIDFQLTAEHIIFIKHNEIGYLDSEQYNYKLSYCVVKQK